MTPYTEVPGNSQGLRFNDETFSSGNFAFRSKYLEKYNTYKFHFLSKDRRCLDYKFADNWKSGNINANCGIFPLTFIHFPLDILI